jgi:hypothetical protein
MPDAASDKPARRRVQVRYYRFRNALKEKAAGSLGGNSVGVIAKEALEAAEAEFTKMAEDYPDWVESYIRKLYELHGRCVDTPELRHQYFKKLNESAHDLKGQGGTFGYMLISRFGDSLYECTRARDDYPDNQVEIVKAHIDAMKAVIAGRVKGDGGSIGQELIKQLQKAIERYSITD